MLTDRGGEVIVEDVNPNLSPGQFPLGDRAFPEGRRFVKPRGALTDESQQAGGLQPAGRPRVEAMKPWNHAMGVFGSRN